MAVCQMDSTRAEGAYELAEDVENDGHSRKRGESGEELDVADIREAGEGEVVQGEHRRQVSCHREEDKGQVDTSHRRGYKTEKSIVPLLPLGVRRTKSPQVRSHPFRVGSSSGRSPPHKHTRNDGIIVQTDRKA